VNNVSSACFVKTPPKNPVGKKVGEECIARASHIALVASLKTLHEKNPVEKNSSREKEYNN
jgi:hypothetical protein